MLELVAQYSPPDGLINVLLALRNPLMARLFEPMQLLHLRLELNVHS